ncbi:hypothetical protein P376_3462 [Streptomyces sp. HCCB10043]|nr:hypothetical protein P376_3462 [Streptomyces sp. HCCB10043]
MAHLAVVQDEDCVAGGTHVFDQVGTEDDGCSRASEGADELAKVETLRWVETDGRLVQQE